jgi:signal transduction histidine kinase
VHCHHIVGPAGAPLLVAERHVRLTIADKPVMVRLAVASDLARLAAARSAFAGDVMLALVLLGLVLAAATAVQVVAGLRPLDALRRGVAHIRSGRDRRLTTEAPLEVRPLIDEVNALLDAREQEIVRSRNRAADLAHGLKTPLAALTADGERLEQKGEAALAADIAGAVDAMRRHVDRELARARIRGGGPITNGVATALAPLVRSLVATVSRTRDGARIAYDIEITDDATAPFDRTDLAEVLGNLLENATRHALTRVRVAATAEGTTIVIEDDGAGIPSDLRAGVLARGIRFDERGDGAGLGLAIVQEVLEAYGWTLHLDVSALGGLKAVIRSQA